MTASAKPVQPGRNLWGRGHALRCSLSLRGSNTAVRMGLDFVTIQLAPRQSPRRIFRLDDVIEAGLADEIGSYRSAPAGCIFPSADEIKDRAAAAAAAEEEVQR